MIEAQEFEILLNPTRASAAMISVSVSRNAAGELFR
jgi:hypothetical protein